MIGCKMIVFPRRRSGCFLHVVRRCVSSHQTTTPRYVRSKKRRMMDADRSKFVMTGVCTADTYNLKLLPSVVRQSDRYSLVDIHSDCRNHVTHVREALPGGLSRNVFIFKFGTAVLWDMPDTDTSAEALALTEELLRPIEQGSSYTQPEIIEDLEQMDYTITSSGNKTFVRDESLILDVGRKQAVSTETGDWVQDQVAVSHALAKSVRLSTVEGQLQRCIDECQQLLLGRRQSLSKREAWMRILEVLNLDAKANHPPVNMDDFYWERGEQDVLHGHVLHVFDYNRRITEFNQLLKCCKEFAAGHYTHAVRETEDKHTYWIVGLIFVSVALGNAE